MLEPPDWYRWPASTRTRASAPSSPAACPEVRLGRLLQGGLAPAILAIVERGVRRRPELAASLLLEVELAVQDGYPPVRIVFDEASVLVEDGPGDAPDLRVRGELADLIGLIAAPVVGGVPMPFTPWAASRCRSPPGAGWPWGWWPHAGSAFRAGSDCSGACLE